MKSYKQIGDFMNFGNLVTFCVSIVILISLMFQVQDRKILNEVKSGERTLTCFIGNEHKVIIPEKITDMIDGRWFFVNGSASNCKVSK